MSIDWQEVIDLNPRGYCEIQDHEKGIVLHGPVESITLLDHDETVSIKMKWIAQMGLPGRPDFGKWVKAPIEKNEFIFPNYLIPFVVEPTEEKGDRIRFDLNIIYIEPTEESDTRIFNEINANSN